MYRSTKIQEILKNPQTNTDLTGTNSTDSTYSTVNEDICVLPIVIYESRPAVFFVTISFSDKNSPVTENNADLGPDSSGVHGQATSTNNKDAPKQMKKRLLGIEHDFNEKGHIIIVNFVKDYDTGESKNY